jgi:hypothetical protein
MVRALRRLAGAAVVAACLAAPAPAGAQVPPIGPDRPSRDPVVAAAGDIACDPDSELFNNGIGDPDHCRQQATSDLLIAADPDAVLPLGDIQYEDAQLWKFQRSYDPSWGRLKDVSRPVIGNHEYFSGGGGAGYFDYFNGVGRHGGPAGDRDKGYYSFDLGSWHLIALNSVCSQVGGCGPGSAQAQWLQADLAAHPSACTLVYWHHPLYTSSGVGWTSMDHVWQLLHEAGADVVLTGHMHQYERFAPLNAAGVVDPAHGIRSFVVGTGGKNLGQIIAPAPGSEAVNTDSFGVLMLTLRDGVYDWRFAPVPGDTFSDSGTASCHGAPPPRPPAATTGPATQARAGGALLNASVEAGAQPASYRFEYGRSETYGLSTPETSIPASGARQAATAQLGGLADGETYHYRVVATNASGSFAGADRTFTAGESSEYADLVAATPGLLAHWRLGESFGGTAFEERGTHPGVFSGSFALRRRGVVVGDSNRAATFDGPFGSLRLFGPGIGRTGAIEGWFRWADGPVLLRDDSSQGGWYIARATAGRLTYRIAGRTFTTSRAIGSVRDGAWHHVVATKDGGFVNLFIDGKLVHSGDGASDQPAAMPWHVMRNGPFEEHALGSADEIAIYDRPLPGSMVRRHYRAGVAEAIPQTRLRPPPRRTNDTNPLVLISSDKRRASLRCAVTGPGATVAAVRSCRSQMRLSGLSDGRYRISAYAVDRAGYADPTPAAASFTVDTVTPTLVVESPERTVRRFADRGLPVTLTCSENCSVRARIVLSGTSARRAKLTHGRPLEIGRALGRVRAGVPQTITVRVAGAEVRKRLRRLRTAAVTLRVSASDAAGNIRGVRTKVPIVR